MVRHLKNRMVFLTVMALMLAQILPAFALTISFTTEANPAFHIISSTLTPGQTGVSYSQPGEFWRMTFSRTFSHIDLYLNGPEGNLFDYGLKDSSVKISTSGGPGNNYVTLELKPGQQLTPGATYEIRFFGVHATDDNSQLDPGGEDAAYFIEHNTGNDENYFHLYFTTVYASGWASTTVNDVNSGNVIGGQTNVPIVNAVIKVKSNNALQSGTVNATNIVLHEGGEGGTTIAASVSLDIDNQTIIVSPGTLKYSTTYYLVLTGVTDTTNTSL